VPLLIVQVHLKRAPALDLNAVLTLFTNAAELADAELEITEGEEDGPFLNCGFRTKDPGRLWEILQGQVFWERVIGPSLAMSSIVVCQGNRGWDDYLLLHHYDRTETLDTLRR